jgi:mannose-1-phosphate guanylyltransferase
MPIDMSSVVSVVLSGGAGTRLWPVSRENYPKPFINLFNQGALIEKTYERVKALGSNLLTITNQDYYYASCDALNRVGILGDFLLEPLSKNTAAPIGLAAKMISESSDPETLILILPADHLITDQSAFLSAIQKGMDIALADNLVIFGISPTSPEVGFGYVELGDRVGFGNRAARFIEKPNLETAKSYVYSVKFLWNTGILCAKAGVLLEEIKRCAPDVADAVDECWLSIKSCGSSSKNNIPEDVFKFAPDISIDFAVLEKSDRVVVVPGNFSWSDIGSWKSVRELVEPDSNKNRSSEPALFLDSHNVFIHSDNRLVAALGVSDLMIIDTTDALLVVSSERSQDVKEVVSYLKKNNHDTYKNHLTVFRPWGFYSVLEESKGFKIKKIEVKPGASLSLQMHKFRSEHWVVVEGVAKVTNGTEEVLVEKNQSTFIPAGQKHRLENPGNVPCVMIEVQCGSYLGEDDIIRFDDKYGR